MADVETIKRLESKYRDANKRAISAVVAGDDDTLTQAREDMRVFRKSTHELERELEAWCDKERRHR